MPTWSMLTFQDSASSSMSHLLFFHDLTMTILTMITMLVLLNLLIIFYSPLTNKHFSQNHSLEVLWTIFPVFILFFIATPSLQALYLLDDPSPVNLTVKATGHQWYWSYSYPDFSNIEFESYMLPYDTNLGAPRLLSTDNSLVLPTQVSIRLIASAYDVIHAWTVPAIGVKIDAIPGRLNQLLFTLNRPGLFYGQCSEICGANHSFMPIKLEALPMKYFALWLSPA